MTKQLTSVWDLETRAHRQAEDDLTVISDGAIAGRRKQQNYLKKLWPECNWTTIKKRLQTEGSVWYVWWMDGVNQHLQNVR